MLVIQDLLNSFRILNIKALMMTLLGSVIFFMMLYSSIIILTDLFIKTVIYEFTGSLYSVNENPLLRALKTILIDGQNGVFFITKLSDLLLYYYAPSILFLMLYAFFHRFYTKPPICDKDKANYIQLSGIGVLLTLIAICIRDPSGNNQLWFPGLIIFTFANYMFLSATYLAGKDKTGRSAASLVVGTFLF